MRVTARPPSRPSRQPDATAPLLPQPDRRLSPGPNFGVGATRTTAAGAARR